MLTSLAVKSPCEVETIHLQLHVSGAVFAIHVTVIWMGMLIPMFTIFQLGLFLFGNGSLQSENQKGRVDAPQCPRHPLRLFEALNYDLTKRLMDDYRFGRGKKEWLMDF